MLARKNTFQFYKEKNERKNSLTCPLCEGTIRYTKNNTYWNLRCQDCRWCGDVITLLMYDKKLNRKQCFDYIAEKLNVELDQKSKNLLSCNSKKSDTSLSKSTSATTQQRAESDGDHSTNVEKIQKISEQKMIEARIKDDGNADFDLFWSEYPRKVSKADAKKSFEKRQRTFRLKRLFLHCAPKRNHGIWWTRNISRTHQHG